MSVGVAAARAAADDIGLKDIFSCTDACVSVPADVASSMKECVKGKSKADALTSCAIPGFNSVDAAMPPLIQGFLARVPPQYRSQCSLGGASLNNSKDYIECVKGKMIAANDPAAPAATTAGDRAIGAMPYLSAYYTACSSLGGTCTPSKWPGINDVPYDPTLPDQSYSSKDVLKNSPSTRYGAKNPPAGFKGGSAGGKPKPPGFFGDTGVGCSDDQTLACNTSGSGVDFDGLAEGYGISTKCLNTFLCDEAWAFSKLMPSNGDVALIRAGWEGYFEKLKSRYEKLRYEMLRRLLTQIAALAAAESVDCEQGVSSLNLDWKGKLDDCGGVDTLALWNEAVGSAAAKARNTAICKANNGGGADAQQKYKKGIRDDAHRLAATKCAQIFIDGFPEQAPEDDAQARMRKADEYTKRFQGGACGDPKSLGDDALTMAKATSGDTFQWTLETGDWFGVGAKREGYQARMASVVACNEAGTNSRIVGLGLDDLKAIDAGGDAPQFRSSPVFQNLVSMFNRACAQADPRGDLSRFLDGGGGAFGLDELEALLGATVSNPDDKDDTYTMLSAKLIACNRQTHTKGRIEDTLEDLEKACGAFAAVSVAAAPAIAATGPVGAGAAVTVNMACALPPAALAAANSAKKNQLTAFRRSLGNQLSCDQASKIMESEVALDQQIKSDILDAALQVGLSAVEIAGLIKSARNAAEAEKLLAERTKLARTLGKEATDALPQLKRLDPDALTGLLERIEGQRPVRASFPEGAAGDKAFTEASTAFNDRVNKALADAHALGESATGEEVAKLLDAQLAPSTSKVAVTDSELATARSKVQAELEKKLGPKAAERFPCLKR